MVHGSSGVHVKSIYNLYMDEKLDSMLPKVEIDIKPNEDAMDGTQGEEARLALKP